MMAKTKHKGTNDYLANRLFRTFTIILLMALLGEIIIRATPEFLEGVKERRWLEWLLVSIVGVSAYLLWNAATWVKSP
ncbi:hypothetical protein KA005_75945, partial [bacterium]|nr:hypothetical protein [bacterium]